MEDRALIPRLRGRFHQVAFLASIPAGVSLVALGRTTSARIGNLIYALSVSGLFAASAAFHRLTLRDPNRPWLQRLDHSMIYVLIAGTYTPFALRALDGAWEVAILSVVWGGGVLGVTLRMAFGGLDVLKQVLYLGLGWTAVVALPAVNGRLTPAELILMFAGGAFYTVGALLFGLKRPDPRPDVFGYHEVWHGFVIAAVLCHFAMILSLTLRPGG
ncbi:MAG TPA: hemolysin III family protein [Actinomycetota bacterium]|jgi:hemolysin III